MTRISRFLAEVLYSRKTKKKTVRAAWRPSVVLLEDRTMPSTLIQVANVDGFVADANQDGSFDTVNTTGAFVQTSSIPSSESSTDQSCSAPAYYNYNTSYGGNLPLGQEFKPTLTSLSFVDLVIADAGSDIGPGANFLVKVHSGTITGTVLGTSATVFVPDNTNISGTSNYTHFTFASPISLSSGSTYVMEIVQTGSLVAGNSNFMITSDNPSGANVYTPGRGIIHGTPVTTNLDFLFREGTAGQPGVTERGVMEFSTAGISSSSVITSAMLSGTIGTLQTSGSGGVGAALYAYAGDGQITTDDATASTTQIGTVSNAALGAFSVNLDLSAIQALTQSSGYTGYLGILVELTSGQRFFLNSTESTAAGPMPTLQIVYDTNNQPPTANNDTFKINPDQSTLTVNAPGVLANDSDPDADPMTASIVTGPSYGSLSLAPDGSFIYTPGPTFSATDSFTYQASDGNAFSNIATVTIRLNHAPFAYDRSFATIVNTPLNVGTPGVLANDYDPDGDPMTALLVDGPSHGTLTLNSDGSFSYIPDQDYTGPDSFTYQASDGLLNSNTAVVSLVVDTLPVAQDDSYSTDEGNTLTVDAPGVLANDSDVNGDHLTAYRVTTTSNGALSLGGNGSFTYTPNAGFYGTDSFTYKVSDGYAFGNTATVTITVNPGIPVAADDAFSVNEDQTLTVSPVIGVTSLVMQSQAGDYIGQGQNYSYSSSTGVFSATRNFDNGVSLAYQDTLDAGAWWYLDFAAPGNAYLTPGAYLDATRYPFQDSNVPGLDVAGEGRGSNGLTGQFTVMQAVYGADDQISRFDATFEQHSEGASPALTGEIKYQYSTDLSGVLINDSDPDGDPLTTVLVTGPAHGTLSFNPDGTFTFQPNANFNGTDSFTYKANDGNFDSNVATVSITVNPVNDAPTFTKGADQTIVEGAGPQTVAGWATAISPGPPDEAGQSLNFIVSTDNDTLFAVTPAIDPVTGTLTYTPAANAVGNATVLVQLHDNGGTDNGGSDTSPQQTFIITIDDAIQITSVKINGNPGATTIASVTEAGNTVTVTMAAADGFTNNESVNIAGIGTTGYNGTFPITVIDDHTFSYNDPTSGLADDNAGGTATNGLAGNQRSMIDSVVYTFNQGVSLAAGAFQIALTDNVTVNGTTGQSAGTIPTLSWSNPSGDNVTWVVTFSGSGVVGQSIADGIYDITIDHTKVTPISGSGVLANDETDTFYRLLGDALGYAANGNQARVSNTDLAVFKNSLNKNPGQSGYQPYFDFLQSGSDTINNADLTAFKTRLGIKTFADFSPTI